MRKRKPRKPELLTKEQIKRIKDELGISDVKEIKVAVLKEFKEKIKNLKDIRCKGKIMYKLWDIIVCIILASFSDCNTWKDIELFVKTNYKWLKSFLQMTGGIPTAQTYERVLSLVDNNELSELLLSIFKDIIKDKKKADPKLKLNCFDGRVNNGSKRNDTLLNDGTKPLNCLNCYSTELGYCIETVQIDEKTNEIPTIEELVKGMDLDGTICSWDALNTQIKNVAAVVAAQGDYVVPIKENQKGFYEALQLYFDDVRLDEIKAGNNDSEYYATTEKNHSSIIKYEHFQTSDIKWYDKLSDWDNVASFGLVKKTITKLEKVKNNRKNVKKEYIKKPVSTTEYRYYISSLNVNVKTFAEIVRKYWGVENKIHWHLDFTFRQDMNTTINKKALLNLEIIHKFVLAVLERTKPEYKGYSLQNIRKELAFDFENNFPIFLAKLIIAK